MEQKKNREWVKNAAIIFLAVLLVLTFFSNTIMNRSLPEVATQNVTSGSIVARVRGTGVVTAVGASQVKADKAREIRSVLVKVGQKVEPGDVLFTLGAGTTEEIEAAEEKVRTLQTNYNRTAASAPLFDYTTDWRRLQNLEKARDEAKAKMDAIANEIEGRYSDVNQNYTFEAGDGTGITDYNESIYSANQGTKQARLNAVNAKIEAAQQLVQKAEKILKDQLEEKQKELENAKERSEAEIAEKLAENQAQIAENNSLIEGANTTQGYYYDYVAASDNFSRVSAELEKLEQERTDYEYAAATLSELRIELEKLQSDKKILEDKRDAETDVTKKQEIQAEIDLIIPQITSKEEEITKVEAVLDPARTAERITKTETLKTEKDSYAANMADLTTLNGGVVPTDQTDYIAGLQAQNAELENQDYSEIMDMNIQAALDALIAVSQEDYDNAVKALDAAILEKETLMEQIDKQKSTEYQAAKTAYETAEDSYRTAQENLAFNMAHDAQTASVTGVDLASLNEQLEIARKKLAELTGEDQQITAKVSGIIQTIDTTAGSVVKKDDILCTIEVPDMGYTMSFSVTNDQANRVRPGDTATVSNFYWGNEVTATLNNIKVDPKNPQNKLLTFDLDGNVTAGSQLTISVGQKSANYDIIIPSSAIRTDANGSFVLRVDAKNSPLGNRYIARRVQVEVLASDDSNSAVTGDLNNGDYVITTSTSPIKSGQLVRLANY